MQQPQDTKTVDMFAKRGRGRPRKENALTPAERAKRYRDKMRASHQSGGASNVVTKVTENEDADFWRGMYEAQLERTVELEARIEAGDGKRLTYGAITEIAERRMVSLLAAGWQQEACGVADLWLWATAPLANAEPRREIDRETFKQMCFGKIDAAAK